ncbi:Npt1/Npt2 family nucleotide transporter [Paenibacillus nasutitermitis]|uniref:ADP,ATP carrier protein n=1 Tax=Paenibacillus nasutitermitis TaxID=1652958 RepID=A0A916ZGB9_9BACL|nr:Npt1/Npt2 family nucleotide transporter [Paenibacillus nasutitermitis]GGD94034.1 hypothetical protein GCM10010911_60910 [Paenibacillus nasutitermitis]
MLAKLGKTLGNRLARFEQDREEYKRVFWLLLYLFFVVSASTVGRTAADALFLSRYDSSMLSKMYLPQAVSLILAGFLFQRFGSRFRLDRLIQFLIPVVSVLAILSRLGIGLQLSWVYPVIYVAYDVFNFLMIVCFWQFAASVLDQRKVKRMIPLVGSGGLIGGIVSGFGLKLIVPLTGTANLIYGYAGLQLLALAMIYPVIRMCASPAESFGADKRTRSVKPAVGSGSAVQADSGLFRSVPHLKYVAILSAALVLSLTLIDYQFKVILRSTLQNDELAGFMGSFYGFSGICALLVQLFVAGKLVTRFGVMTSILVFPVALLAGSIGILFLPVLAMAVLVKGSDKVLGDTIYSSVSQLIMFPIPPEWRNRAKSFLDGIVRNGAKGLAAISLLVLSPLLDAKAFSYMTIALLLVCLFAAIKVKGAYLEMLLSTLKGKGHDETESELDWMDPASRMVLVEALQSPDRQQALYALRVLGGLDEFDLGPHIPGLLAHPASDVRIAALVWIEQAKPAGLHDEIVELLHANGDSRVKAQAFMTLAAYSGEGDLAILSDGLEAADVEVKAGAIAGLIKYYGIEGMFRAVGTLKALIGSASDEDRTAMASLFGRMGIREFYKPLIALLEDSSDQVAQCALQSAGELRVPELVPYVLPHLQKSGTRRAAIDALASYEETVLLPLLVPYFSQEPTPLHLPAVFERIATQAAFDMLLQQVGDARHELRNKLVESLTRMRRTARRAPVALVEQLILQDMELTARAGEHLTVLAGGDAYREAAAAASEFRASLIRRIFGHLGLIYETRTIEAVYINWSEGDARGQANAAEVLDQLLHGPLRLEMTKLILVAPLPVQPFSPSAAKQSLAWFYEHGDDWLRQVILAGTTADEALRRRMARIHMLRGVELFEGLDDKELNVITEYLQEVSYKLGETVFKEGDPGDALYLVEAGRAGIYRGGVKVDERMPGEGFGQTAILTRRLRSAAVRAEEDMRLLRLDSADFYEAMFDRTDMALAMMKHLSRRLRAELGKSAQAPRTSEQTGMDEQVQNIRPLQDVDISNDSILRRVLVLQKIELFSHLGQEDFIRLAKQVDEVVYEAGEVICKAQEYGDTMFGIISGSIRVHLGSETLAILEEGQCFGEMAIIDSGPRSADCSAEQRTVLLQLHRDQVFSFCFQQIEVLKSMMQVLSARLRDMG